MDAPEVGDVDVTSERVLQARSKRDRCAGRGGAQDNQEVDVGIATVVATSSGAVQDGEPDGTLSAQRPSKLMEQLPMRPQVVELAGVQLQPARPRASAAHGSALCGAPQRALVGAKVYGECREVTAHLPSVESCMTVIIDL